MMPRKLSKALIFCHKYGIMSMANLLLKEAQKWMKSIRRHTPKRLFADIRLAFGLQLRIYLNFITYMIFWYFTKRVVFW